MATIHAMPSPASEAVELDRQIRGAVRDLYSSFARIAYYGWRLKLSDGFKELGFANEYVYMTSLGIGRTRWFEAVAVGKHFILYHLQTSKRFQLIRLCCCCL